MPKDNPKAYIPGTPEHKKYVADMKKNKGKSSSKDMYKMKAKMDRYKKG